MMSDREMFRFLSKVFDEFALEFGKHYEDEKWEFTKDVKVNSHGGVLVRYLVFKKSSFDFGELTVYNRFVYSGFNLSVLKEFLDYLEREGIFYVEEVLSQW